VTEIEIRLTLHSIALESLMAAPSHRRCRSGPEYEDRLQEAIAGVRSKRFKQEEAATIFNVSCCPNLFHLLMFFKVSLVCFNGAVVHGEKMLLLKMSLLLLLLCLLCLLVHSPMHFLTRNLLH
jgi:hypothetical protein